MQPGLVLRIDPACQYCSERDKQRLAEYGLVPSMSRRANCWDNAVAESTFGRFKTELVHRQSYTDADEARTSVFEYGEVFWNRDRRHSTLGGVCPNEYEQSHNPDTR